MTRVAKLLTTAVLSGAVVLSGAQLAGASAVPATQSATTPTTVQTVSVAEVSVAQKPKSPRAKRLVRIKREGARVADRKRATYREVLNDPKMTDLEGIGPQLETAAKQGLARTNQLSRQLRKAKKPRRAAAIVKQLRALQADELHEVGRTAVAAYYAQENPSAIGDLLELLEGSPLAGPLAPVIAIIRGLVDKIDDTPLGSIVGIIDTLLGGLTGLLKNLIGQLPLPPVAAP